GAAAFIWLVARNSEKKNFTAMLARLSNVTVKLKDAEHFGHFGSFNWDADAKKTFWSEEMFTLFDMVPGQTPPSIAKVISMVLLEDREKAETAMKRAQEIAGPFSISFRVLGAGQVIRYLRFEGKTTLDTNKQFQTMEGVAHDITHEVEVERAKT